MVGYDSSDEIKSILKTTHDLANLDHIKIFVQSGQWLVLMNYLLTCSLVNGLKLLPCL